MTGSIRPATRCCVQPAVVSRTSRAATGAGERRPLSLSRRVQRPIHPPGAPMRRFAALLAAVILTACTNEIDQSTRPTAVVGSYQLRTYGGRSLPAQVSTD